jgi:hypothetical protein
MLFMETVRLLSEFYEARKYNIQSYWQVKADGTYNYRSGLNGKLLCLYCGMSSL